MADLGKGVALSMSDRPIQQFGSTDTKQQFVLPSLIEQSQRLLIQSQPQPQQLLWPRPQPQPQSWQLPPQWQAPHEFHSESKPEERKYQSPFSGATIEPVLRARKFVKIISTIGTYEDLEKSINIWIASMNFRKIHMVQYYEQPNDGQKVAFFECEE